MLIDYYVIFFPYGEKAFIFLLIDTSVKKPIFFSDCEFLIDSLYIKNEGTLELFCWIYDFYGLMLITWNLRYFLHLSPSSICANLVSYSCLWSL